MTAVAAVIGNFQGEALLPDVLESLARQTHPPAETIVVDGESTDASLAVAARHGARVIAERNGGLAYLYQRGAAGLSRSRALKVGALGLCAFVIGVRLNIWL